MSDGIRVAGARRANVSREREREHVREHVREHERDATERPSVVRAQLDRAPERDAHNVYRAPHPHLASGTAATVPQCHCAKTCHKMPHYATICLCTP